MQDEVTVHIEAPPEAVWALVSDVTRIGEFSPETFEAEWLDGDAGPEVGARFRGHVKRNGKGPIYWRDCYVTKVEPNQAFEFGVGKPGKALNTWGYRIEPAAEGTNVTEYFRLKPNLPLRVYWAVLGWARGKTNHNGMQTTLDRMKAVLEAG